LKIEKSKIDELQQTIQDVKAQLGICLRKYSDRIQKQSSEGSQYGISGTPTFYVGNNKAGYTQILGAQPVTIATFPVSDFVVIISLSNLIDPLLLLLSLAEALLPLPRRVALDQLDINILHSMSSNCRASYYRLSSEIGFTAKSIKDRVKKIQSDDIISIILSSRYKNIRLPKTSNYIIIINDITTLLL
jgi:hypothetical protein